MGRIDRDNAPTYTESPVAQRDACCPLPVRVMMTMVAKDSGACVNGAEIANEKRTVKKSPLKRKPSKLKRSSLKRRSKNPKAVMKARAWKEFSLYIRTRDPKCVTCGGQTTQAGHFIHNVSNSKLHFDERNVHGQDARCNLYLSGNLTVYTLFMLDTYGKKVVKELLAMKEDRTKLDADRPTKEWYEEIYTKYKAKNGALARLSES